MAYRLSGAVRPRSALFLVALVASAACSLTEAVRTIPGPPGEVPTFSDGGQGGSSPVTDAGGHGAEDATVDGGHSGGSGKGGTGGRSGAGGGGGIGGTAIDGGHEPEACSAEITFACHDYCRGLAQNDDCRHKLREAAGVKPDGGAFFPDGSIPHELAVVELLARCDCNCEHWYRMPACQFEFNQFIQCGEPDVTPLTVVCATDPDLSQEFPSVIGPCGSARSTFVKCLETPPPPPRDGGPS